MKILTSIFCLTCAVLLLNVGQSFALPPCPSNLNAYYDKCFGTVTYDNGDKYVGEWKDDKMNIHGSYTYANGNKHVGEYKDNKANGQGTYIYANGNKYVGEFKGNKKNGQGIFIYANGGKYDGEWKDDKYNGQGTYIFSNGDKYIGEFENDKANGQGTLTYGNKNIYVSEYEGDKRMNRRISHPLPDGRVEREGLESTRLLYAEKIPPTVTINKFYKPPSKSYFKKGLTTESGDFETALGKWKSLAEQGDADAQSNMGWIYQYIQDVPQDYRAAVKWYRLAAKQGHVDAQNYLAVMYEQGKGVPQNDKVAMEWWKLAAEQGNISAQNSLGWIYDSKKDYQTAVKWYKRAAEQGYALAQYNLAYIYDSKEDYQSALKWYKLSAEQGVARAEIRRQDLQKQITERKGNLNVTDKKPLKYLGETQKELERVREEIAQLIKDEKNTIEPPLTPKIGALSLGFSISKIGHVITNHHIVSKCKKVTVGDNAQNQVSTDIIGTDIENDLALLKAPFPKMASVEAKYHIKKIGIKMIPLSLGVPTYSQNRDIISMVVVELNKRKLEKRKELIPANMNIGIKVSILRQFLSASGLPTKWSKQSKSMSISDLNKVAKNLTMMVICHQ